MITSNLERSVDNIWYTSFYCGCGVKGVKVVKIKHRGGKRRVESDGSIAQFVHNVNTALRRGGAVGCGGPWNTHFMALPHGPSAVSSNFCNRYYWN